MTKSPPSLLSLSLASIPPVEFVSLLSVANICESIKLAFFKRLVRDIYLSCPHTSEDLDAYGITFRLDTVFDCPNHTCCLSCDVLFNKRIKIVQWVLKPQDFLLFLFTADKFLGQGLKQSVYGTLRSSVVMWLLQYAPHTGFNTLNIRDRGRMMGNFFDTLTKNNSWYSRTDRIFEENVGPFVRQATHYTCFDEYVNPRDYENRTVEAKCNIQNLLFILPLETRAQLLFTLMD